MCPCRAGDQRAAPPHACQDACLRVELGDHLVPADGLREEPRPEVAVVPKGLEIGEFHLLLLDPGVVLEVVDRPAVGVGKFLVMVSALAEEAALQVARGPQRRVGAALGGEFGQARAVEVDGVGGDGQDDVVAAEVEVPSRLDRGDQVADAERCPAGAELSMSRRRTRPASTRVAWPAGSLNSRSNAQALLVVNRGDHVGVAHVVNPGHVLVADALDAVPAEAVHAERRALQRLGGDDLQRRDARCAGSRRRRSCRPMPVAET